MDWMNWVEPLSRTLSELRMVLSMFAAGLAGALVPMLPVAARQDPAQASSIILTTVTDIVGFFSFLGIGTAGRNALIVETSS